MDNRRERRVVGGKVVSLVRKHSRRLNLETLEDRCLLSAGFTVIPLASDVPGQAPTLDPNLVNPWGMSFSPTGPFWFGDKGSGVSDLLDGSGNIIPLVVTVPAVGAGTGAPTGTVFNGGPGFVVSENGLSGSAQFLFATEDGTISGWAPGVDMTHAVIGVNNSASGAIYKGLALATDADGHSFLFAANFSNGTVDVFDQNFQPVTRTGAFQDSALPRGYAPFNIENIGNLLYVAYARQDALHYDDSDGPGAGFIDVYNLQGGLVKRLVSGGELNAPWGMRLAPATFGAFGGDLLVGNAGDGHVSAYNPTTGALVGQLEDSSGQPLALNRLWGLSFGNGHLGGDPNTLFFAAGLDGENHGIFGAVQAPHDQGDSTAGFGKFDPNAPGERSDYPLPPANGPAMQNGNWNNTTTVAALLPLAESSLAMAPTLFSVPQLGTNVVVPATNGPFTLANLGRSGGGTLVASTANFVPDDTQLDTGTPANSSLALNTFLDLDTVRAPMPDAGAGDETDTQPLGDGGVSAPAPAVGGGGRELQPNSQAPATELDARQDEATLAVMVETAAQERSPTPLAVSVRKSAAGPSQDRGQWTLLVTGVFSTLWVSTTWGFSMGRRRKTTKEIKEKRSSEFEITHVS